MEKAKFNILQEDIENNKFGVEVADFWMELDEKKKEKTLQNLYRTYQTRTEIYGFVYEMQMIFPECVIFREREQPFELYVFLGTEETRKNIRMYQAIKKLFLPISYQTKEAYEKVFAMLDICELETSGNQMI